MTKPDTKTTTNGSEGPPEADAPKKRGPGAPKGRPKPPGSGRKKNVVNWDNQSVRREVLPLAVERLKSILELEMQTISGPLGKKIRRLPMMAEVLQASKIVIDKTLPSLSAVQLSGDAENPIAVEYDNLSLARAVMSILESANIAEADTNLGIIEGTFHGVAAPSVDAADGVGDSPPAAAPSWQDRIQDEPANTSDSDESFEDGEYELLDNGVQIQLVEIEGSGARKFAVIDHHGMLHGYRRTKASAKELAANIKNVPNADAGTASSRKMTR